MVRCPRLVDSSNFLNVVEKELKKPNNTAIFGFCGVPDRKRAWHDSCMLNLTQFGTPQQEALL
jgi:hypothetical protein